MVEKITMHRTQKVFLVAAVVNAIASIIQTNWGEALWTVLAFWWCLIAWGYEKEAKSWARK